MVLVLPQQCFHLFHRAVSHGKPYDFGWLSLFPAQFREVNVLGHYDKVVISRVLPDFFILGGMGQGESAVVGTGVEVLQAIDQPV